MENTSDFIEYRIDTRRKLLYSRWLRNVTPQEYKAGLHQVHELLVQNEVTHWLQDSNALQPRNIEDQKWAAEEFGILLIQSPLKFLAVVVPSTSMHYPVICSLREKAYRIFGKTKLMEVFNTTEEALAWLLPNMQHYRLSDMLLHEIHN